MRAFRAGVLLSLMLAVALVGCTNSPDAIAEYSELEQEPELSADSITLIYAVRGKTDAVVCAPLMRSSMNGDVPYDEFPKGISVYSYRGGDSVESMIQANYALYSRKQKLWDARYNVVAVNEEGDTIRTEQIFWDEAAKRVYTSANVRIRKKGVILYGRGFESDDRFTNWVINEPQGIISINRKEKQANGAKPDRPLVVNEARRLELSRALREGKLSLE